MLNFIFAILLIVGPWSLGVVLASKLSESMRAKLKPVLTIALILVVINAIIIACILIMLLFGSLVVGTPYPLSPFSGGFDGTLPQWFSRSLTLFVAGYYWTRFFISRIKEKWAFVTFITFPIIICVVLALPSISRAVALEDARKEQMEAKAQQRKINFQKEKEAIRDGVRHCYFNSTKYDLPHSPYVSCGRNWLNFNSYERLKNKKLYLQSKKIDWVLAWQDNCKKEIAQDRNCDFEPPLVSFRLLQNVNSHKIESHWRALYDEDKGEFNEPGLRSPRPHTMLFQNLVNKEPVPSSVRGVIWAAKPTYFETDPSKMFPHFTKGVRCSDWHRSEKSKARKSVYDITKRYSCEALVTIFDDDLDGFFSATNSLNHQSDSVKIHPGISFIYEAENLDEILSHFNERRTNILSYIKYINNTYDDDNYVPTNETVR